MGGITTPVHIPPKAVITLGSQTLPSFQVPFHTPRAHCCVHPMPLLPRRPATCTSKPSRTVSQLHFPLPGHHRVSRLVDSTIPEFLGPPGSFQHTSTATPTHPPGWEATGWGLPCWSEPDLDHGHLLFLQPPSRVPRAGPHGMST